jgi:hypothetical protein
MGWLSAPQGSRKTAALVVKFATAVQANAAIKAGKLSWKGRPREVFRYDSECRVCQCQVCKQYGHIARHCTKTFACGWCGKLGLDKITPLHPEKDCPERGEHGKKKCVLCTKEHSAWSPTCTHRKEELKRIQLAKDRLRTKPYFHETSVCSPGPSEIGSAESNGTKQSKPLHNTSTESPKKRKAVTSAGSPPERKTQVSPTKNSRLARRRTIVSEDTESDITAASTQTAQVIISLPRPTATATVAHEDESGGSELSRASQTSNRSSERNRGQTKDYAALAGKRSKSLPRSTNTD